MPTSALITVPVCTIWQEPAVIHGLPEHLCVCPDDPQEWATWKIQVSAYREAVRRQILADKTGKVAAIHHELSRRDPNYWIVMFGVIFEPRALYGEREGWKRWIPFAYQVRLVVWIQWVNQQEDLGRGDGVVEKSREMGVSWTYCGFMAHQFIYQQVFVGGFVSRNEEAVEKRGDTDSIFYKLRAVMGLEEGVPSNLRLPVAMRLPKFTKEDNCFHRLITYDENGRTNVLKGETTTTLSGVGGRSTMRLNDEAARFNDFAQAWHNQGATTNHRHAVSSADNVSPYFNTLARSGEAAVQSFTEAGPSWTRLEYFKHPFHTDRWLANERARFKDDPAFFEREYLISYTAGAGEIVYPVFIGRKTEDDVTFDPYLGQLYVWIDPGVADPAALIIAQEDPAKRTINVLDCLQGIGGESPEFFASIVAGVPQSGYGGFNYDLPGVLELIDFFADLRRPIVFYGDPYGNNRGGDGKKTWYEAFSEAVKQYSNGSKRAYVQTITAEKARDHLTRKNAVNVMAPRLVFANTPGGLRVLQSFQDARYPKLRDNSQATLERLNPIHDSKSHVRTAGEFGLVNLSRLEAGRAVGKAPVKRRGGR